MRRNYLILVAAIILVSAAVAIAIPMLEHGFASQSQTDNTTDLEVDMFVEARSSEGGLVSIPSVKYQQSQDKQSYLLSDNDRSVTGTLDVRVPTDKKGALNVVVDFEDPRSWMFIDTMTLSVQRDTAYVILGMPGTVTEYTIIKIGSDERGTIQYVTKGQTLDLSGYRKWGYGEDLGDSYTLKESDFYRNCLLLVDSTYDVPTGYNIIKIFRETHDQGPPTYYTTKENVKKTNIEFSGSWQVWGAGQPTSYTLKESDAYRPEPTISSTIYDSSSETGVAGRPSTNISVRTSMYNFVIDVKYKSKVSVVPDEYQGENMVSNVVFLVYERYAVVKYHANSALEDVAGTMEDQTINSNYKILNANAFVRTGYTFAGWNTVPGGTGTAFADKATISDELLNTLLNLENPQLELYAQWVESKTITLDQSGATIPITPSSVEWVKGYTILDLSSLPVKTGWVFDGFYTQEGGLGSQVYGSNGEIKASVDGYTDASKKPVEGVFVEDDITLYAKWIQAYTVTVKLGEHTVATSTSETGYAEHPVSISITPEPGYSFPLTYLEGVTPLVNGVTIGWKDENKDTITITGVPLARTEFDLSGKTGMVAKTYTITLNNGTGGSGATSLEGVVFGQGTFTSIVDPTNSDASLKFVGYYTSAEGGTKIIDSGNSSSFMNVTVEGYLKEGKWNRDEATTLYAVWGHNLTYDGNTYDSGSEPVTKSYAAGEKAIVSGNTGSLAKSGFVFEGWYLSADPTKIYKAGDEITMNGSDMTLYAKWATEVIVTLDQPDAETPIASTVTWAVGFPVENLGSLPVRGGYVFAGFYTEEGGTGTQIYDANGAVIKGVSGYTDGDGKAIKDTAFTLYVKWIEGSITYKVRFNSNGGDGGGPMAEEVFAYGTPQALTTNTFTKTGMSFVGWATTSIGDKIYDDGQSVENLSAVQDDIVNLYAVWGYDLTYIATGATYDGQWKLWNGDDAGAYVVSSTDTYERFIVLVKGGVTISGNPTVIKVTSTTEATVDTSPGATVSGSWKPWNGDTVVDPTVASLTTHNGFVVLVEDDVTLSKTTVIKIMNGTQADVVTGGPGEPIVKKAYKPGTVVTISGQGELEMSGVSLWRWNTSTEYESGTRYTPGSVILMPSRDLTLYTEWKYTGLNVICYPNGGAGIMDIQEFTSQSVTKTLADNDFTAPTGKVFVCWNTAADGSGVSFSENANISALMTSPASNLVLYAIWGYTITFDDGDATTIGTMNNQSGTIGYVLPTCGYTSTDDPVKSFLTWSVKIGDHDAVDRNPGESIDIIADTVVTALWGYDISFNAGGGGGTMPNKVGGVGYVLPPNGFSAPEGMVFKEWSISITGEDPATNVPGHSIDITNDTVVTAIWGYLVTVDAGDYGTNPSPASFSASSGGAISNDGSSLTIDGKEISATADDGYTLTLWVITNSSEGTPYVESTVPTNAITATAQYTAIVYSISATDTDSVGGITLSAASGAIGQEITVTAPEGYNIHEFTKAKSGFVSGDHSATYVIDPSDAVETSIALTLTLQADS